jgi:hypothetical protein
LSDFIAPRPAGACAPRIQKKIVQVKQEYFMAQDIPSHIQHTAARIRPLKIITPYFAENRFRIIIGLLSLIVVDMLQLIIPASQMGRG